MSDFYAIAYRTHHFSNPFGPDTLDRALEPAALRPGLRAAELGCGGGAVAVHLADRYGLAVDAVDMSAAMLAGAQARLADRPAGAPSVALHQARVEEFLASAPEPYDLLTVLGATELVSAGGERRDFFAGLRPHLKPGGHLLYGDPFWRRPPSAALAAVTAPYGTLAGYLEAGAAAGMEARGVVESTQAEWDDYAWRMARSVGDWVRTHRDHPAAPAMAGQARFMRESYLGETRDSMGFALCLFRAP